MILKLPTNSANFIGRLFMLAMTFFLAYLLINFGLKDSKNEHTIFTINLIHFKFKVAYLMYLLISIVGLSVLTISSSLLTINKVLIDTTNNTITFIGLISKQTIATTDIKEYFDSVHKNAVKSWHGLIIKTSDNKSIQIAGQNVKSVSELQDYLINRKIFCAGQKKMMFPF